MANVGLHTASASFTSALFSLQDEAQFSRTRTLVDTLTLVKRVMTYQPAAEVAGYGANHQRDPNFHRHLGRTMEEDVKAKVPPRCSLIINKDPRIAMPGESYFEQARRLGFTIAKNMPAERAFWEDQIRLLGLDPKNLTP